MSGRQPRQRPLAGIYPHELKAIGDRAADDIAAFAARDPSAQSVALASLVAQLVLRFGEPGRKVVLMAAASSGRAAP